MKVCLVRHGIAVPRDAIGIADADRALTEEGAAKMRDAARGLSRSQTSPDLILSSSLARAMQTAEIVQASFRPIPKIEETEHLAPEGSRQALYAEIRRRREMRLIMLVGHQPSLGEIGGEIVWGNPEACFDLKKGGACLIGVETFEPRIRGVLRWLVTPSILRAL